MTENLYSNASKALLTEASKEMPQLSEIEQFSCDDNDEKDAEKMPYTHSLIADSLEHFLEGLYEVKD